MALSGSVTSANGYTDQYGTRRLTFSWTATQSIANNTSTISWTLSTSGGYPYWIYYSKTKVVVDGATVYYVEGKQQISPGTIATGTVTLTHNSVGERSFSASVQAGIYEHAVNCTASGTWTLDTIPRASTVTGSSLVFGTQGTLNISRASANFADTITYALGTYTGTIATLANNSSTSQSVNWTPPLNMMNAIPNATSAAVQITCKTYADNTGATLIATKTSTVTVSIPSDSSMNPTLAISYTNTDDTFGVLAQGLSAIHATLTGTGKYSATIASYTTTLEGASYTGADVTTNVINGSGTVNIKYRVTDSRGRYYETTVPLTVTAYSTPTIEFSVHRCLQDGTADDMGAYAKVWIKGNGTEIGSGAKANAVTPTLQMRQAGQNPPAAWTDVDVAHDTTYSQNNTICETDIVIAADDTKSWEFRAMITDKASASSQPSILISVGYATIDFLKGGRGVSFGTTALSPGFKCAMDTEFSGDVYLGATNLATALASLGGLDFTSVKIRVGTQTILASVGNQQKIFTYAELDTLFDTTNTGQTNCLVLAANGHWEAHAAVINGTINKTDGVYMYSASGFLGANFRFNYIAIRF